MKVQPDKLKVQHDQEKQRFFIDLPEEAIAYLNYEKKTDAGQPVMDFKYTFVDESFREQGVATKLVRFGLVYAQSSGYKIEPSCGFVAAFVEKHPQFQNQPIS